MRAVGVEPTDMKYSKQSKQSELRPWIVPTGPGNGLARVAVLPLPHGMSQYLNIFSYIMELLTSVYFLCSIS